MGTFFFFDEFLNANHGKMFFIGKKLKIGITKKRNEKEIEYQENAEKKQ